MQVRVERVELPGIGTRHDVVTASGRRIGVVSHRSGERELAFFDTDDPDACRDSIPLTGEEASAVADVLGASLMLGQLAGLSEQAASLLTEQISIPADSPYANRPLGDTRTRSRTGASIVAVLREQNVIASPTPDFVLALGDVLVVVGTRGGLDGLARILADDSA